MRYLKTGKQISMIFLFSFVSMLTSRASIHFSGYKIYPQYLISGSLTVVDPSVKTPFKFDLALGRPITSIGTFADGACSVTLMMKPYSYCSGCSTEEIAVSKKTSITNADWLHNGLAQGFMYFAIDGELPVGAKGGALFLRVTYYNTDQNKILTEDKFHGSAVVNYVPPVIPPVNVSDLFTYPALNQYEVGFKLPEEEVELKWKNFELGASTVSISIYEIDTTYPGGPVSPVLISKKQIPNTGSFKLDAAALQALKVKLSFDNHFSYYMVVEDVVGKKFGKSGLFCFVNEHPGLWPDDTPNVFPHAFWIFRPDSSGSGYGELKVRWLVDRINASNVSIDLYNEDGTFNRNLVHSTPNNGNFILPKPNGVPLGPFYQFKITSIEHPSAYGFSEVFHHYLD